MRPVLALILLSVAPPLLARQPSPQVEANKALVRRAFAAMEQGDIETINQLFDSTGPSHNTRGATSHQGGPHTQLKDVCPMCAALAQRKITIDLVVADGDMVSVRSTWTGVYTGTTHGVLIKDKPVSVVYTNFYRVQNGRIVENWFQPDNLHLAEQLGFQLTPPPSH